MGCTGSNTVVETVDSLPAAPVWAKPVPVQRENTAMKTVHSVQAAPLCARPARERDFHMEYALNAKLGQGTFAVVYAATHKDSGNEQLAVKVMDMRDASSKPLAFDDKKLRVDWPRRRDVVNEIAMLSTVSGHDNVCRMSERFIHGGLAYIVFDRYDRTLHDALDCCAPLNEEALRPFFQGMLMGIAAVHARHIVHRDVKPDNFMCSGPDNTVKLCDFGFACALDTPGVLESMECIGIVGTAPYLAPEMLEYKEYGSKVDVWSFGVVVHALLCGCFPYMPHERTSSSMKAAILSGVPTSKILSDASDHDCTFGGMSEEARRLIVNVLSRCANNRPTSREALLDEFFTSQSLAQICLRRKFEAAKSCGAFDHTSEMKTDIGDVDLRLRQLQDRRCELTKTRLPSSDVSTDTGSKMGDSGQSSESSAR